jgi:hypothetical protein
VAAVVTFSVASMVQTIMVLIAVVMLIAMVMVMLVLLLMLLLGIAVVVVADDAHPASHHGHPKTNATAIRSSYRS